MKLATNTNLLTLTPVRVLEHKYREDGGVDVLVPRFKYQFLQRLLPRRRSRYINANLDTLGSATWELIDGQRTATDIIQELESSQTEPISGATERVGMFLQQLYRNNFITFIELLENKNV